MSRILCGARETVSKDHSSVQTDPTDVAPALRNMLQQAQLKWDGQYGDPVIERARRMVSKYTELRASRE